MRSLAGFHKELKAAEASAFKGEVIPIPNPLLLWRKESAHLVMAIDPYSGGVMGLPAFYSEIFLSCTSDLTVAQVMQECQVRRPDVPKSITRKALATLFQRGLLNLKKPGSHEVSYMAMASAIADRYRS